MAAAALTATAAEEIVFDLTTQDAFNRCSKTSLRYDHDSYTMWTFSTYSGITLSNYSIYAYDDYLTTPDLALEPGQLYVVYACPALYSTLDSKCELNVLLGQGDDLASYDLLASLESTSSSYAAETQEVTFMVPEAGNYRISFEGLTRLYLKNTKICSRGESAQPKAPEDFAITPDPDGALSLTVSFTMPSTTLTGQPLTAPRYNLYRGVQKIRNGVEAAPGELVTLSEVRGETGNVTYAVEILCGDETSEKLSAVTYVGPETPEAPGDVALTVAGSDVRLEWSAPVKGIHGAPLAPEKLSYTVSRVLDGVATTVCENTRELSFTETLVAEGLQTLAYTVTARYGAQALESAVAQSSAVRIGSLDMPFADSFAGGAFSPLWDNECVAHKNSNLYYWTAAAKGKRPAVEPYDGDGGLAYYNFYNIQAGNDARLSTPPLAYSAGDRPTLSFAKYNIASNSKKDVVKVQISCDNGEWTDVPDAVFTPQGVPASEWTVCSVALADAIPAATKTFRVGLLTCNDYGEDFIIDDVRVFNLVDKDLEVASVAIPAAVKAGNSVELAVRVSNNGASDVAASDYSLEIISDFPAVPALGELLDIPALSSVTYTLTIPVNAIHGIDTESYSFNAAVTCDGDEVPANNTGEACDLAVEYSDGQAVDGLVAERLADGSIALSWNPAKDLSYTPVNIVESFEDESFADGSTGPFNGWTVIDIDGRSGSNWYTASGSVFRLAKNASTPSLKDGRNVLGVTVASNVTQDDWIISPEISCKDGREMCLDMLLGLKQISSYGNKYTVEIRYSTAENYDVLNPGNDFTHLVASASSTSSADSWVPQDNKMHEVKFSGIPSEARYVAIHFVAKGSYDPAMWVDNIRLYEVDANPLVGYRIYDVAAGRLLVDGLVDAEASGSVLDAEAEAAPLGMTRPVFVCAVYPDGESRPSNFIDLDRLTTGVEAVDASDAPGQVRFYNLQGIEVAGPNPAPGIYIRRSGSRVEKVRLR